ELGLLPGPRTAANVGPAGLIVGVGAGARHLEPLANAGRPRLEVVGFGGCEAEVIRRQQGDAVWELQLLKHSLGMAGQLLVLRRRVGSEAEPHQLDLVELMDTQ